MTGKDHTHFSFLPLTLSPSAHGGSGIDPLLSCLGPESLLWAMDSLLFLCGELILGRGFKCERPLLLCQEEFRAWGGCSVLACPPPKKEKPRAGLAVGPRGLGGARPKGTRALLTHRCPCWQDSLEMPQEPGTVTSWRQLFMQTGTLALAFMLRRRKHSERSQ